MFNRRKGSSDSDDTYDVVVVGAGFSGVFTALELARSGKSVALIERGDRVIPACSSSYVECYKLHLGMHYAGDTETAIKCLGRSLDFAMQFPGYLAGEDKNAPQRRGRHYIMSNSLFSLNEITATAEQLKNHYAARVRVEPSAKVFGEPDDFIRKLKPEEYPHVSSTITTLRNEGQGGEEDAHVAIAYETAESQINIDKFIAYLQEDLDELGVKIIPNTTVTALKETENDTTFSVVTEGSGEPICANAIVNCSWHGIEKLNATLGVEADKDVEKLNRVKVCLVVELPESLKEMETSIFSVGPYSSITNLGGGRALLTYEPVTNIGHYNSYDEAPKDLAAFVSKEPLVLDMMMPDGTEQIKDAILNGVARFIPDMAKAVPIELRSGIVKVDKAPEEKYELDTKDSLIHKRQEDGIQNLQPGVIACAGMKMTYTRDNADRVRTMLTEFAERREAVLKAMKNVLTKLLLESSSTVGEMDVNQVWKKHHKAVFKWLDDQTGSLLSNPTELGKALQCKIHNLMSPDLKLSDAQCRVQSGSMFQKAVPQCFGQSSISSTPPVSRSPAAS